MQGSPVSRVEVVEQILDLARWAPSGDNAQPWRFEIIDGSRFVIHGRDTRDHCIYDLDGRSSQLALGALIETAAIAASRFGLDLQARRRPDGNAARPTFDVELRPVPGLVADALWRFIPERSVQRRPLSRRALSGAQHEALQAAVGPAYELVCFEGAQRWSWAQLLWANAGLRLRLPEAFETHRSVIEWGARFSRTRLPDQALGVDGLTLVVMHTAMADWRRIRFMNRWLGGTLMPRLLMDLVPALACAAHIALIAREPVASVDDHVASGRAVQRFWLQATRLGLQHQPAATPLVFARYLREGRHFTADTQELRLAQTLAARLDGLLGGRSDQTVWLGRIGLGPAAESRSVRRPLSELLM